MLLRRHRLSVGATLERLVGMQAQAPRAPYVGLWSRVDGFEPAALERALTARRAVRISLMRNTIHLVTARDCLALRPLMDPMLERTMLGTWRRHLDGVDLDDLAVAGRELVERRPRTYAELSAALAERWPVGDPAALGRAVGARVPLVQVPPRGLWTAGGRAAHTSAEAWLGRGPEPDPSHEDLVLRYLRAFGPATVRDVQAWCGLTRLRDVVDRLRPRLRVFHDADGRELFDLPRAPRPGACTPAPPRFLPEYDNLLLSHADRTRVLADQHRWVVPGVDDRITGSLLVDGFVRGTWYVERAGARATLRIALLAPLPRIERAAVAEEGGRLLAFTDAGADARRVRFAS